MFFPTTQQKWMFYPHRLRTIGLAVWRFEQSPFIIICSNLFFTLSIFRAWPCLTCWSISFFVLIGRANRLQNWTFFTRPSSPSTKELPLWTASLKDLVRLIFTMCSCCATQSWNSHFSTGGIQTKFVEKMGVRKNWLQSWKFNSWRWKNRHLTTNQPGKPRHPPSLMMRAFGAGEDPRVMAGLEKGHRFGGIWRDCCLQDDPTYTLIFQFPFIFWNQKIYVGSTQDPRMPGCKWRFVRDSTNVKILVATGILGGGCSNVFCSN